jgi:hypothetical protein
MRLALDFIALAIFLTGVIAAVLTGSAYFGVPL